MKVAAAGLDVLPEEPTIREEVELPRSTLTDRHNRETLFAGHMLAHHASQRVRYPPSQAAPSRYHG